MNNHPIRTDSASLLNSTMSISRLSEDTIADILSRIPVKSIIQLKCVCKSWRSLISSSHFVTLQLNRVVNDVNLRCDRLFVSGPLQSIDCDDVHGSSIPLDFIPDHDRDISIAGSCNGLVCVVLGYDKIVVFNPTTRVLIELPKSGILVKGYDYYGFGYVSSTDDYKLVRVVRPYNSHVSGEPVSAEIFSFKNNCWRRIGDIRSSSCIRQMGVFLNGALHWLLWSSCKYIVTFDLETEQFSEPVSLPKSGVNVAHSVNVLHGCLSVVCTNPDFELWVMKEYGVEESWAKVCTVSFEMGMIPIWCSKNGEIVMDGPNADLVMYNPQESTFTEITEIGIDSTTVVYVETLVSPRIGQ